MTLKPFFTFYGGKWRAAPRYPAPIYDTIVEPFAGAAGYSVRHHTKNVVLVERDPMIAAVWRYLISVSPEEILALPDIQNDQTVDNLNVCTEARYLIGFWISKGSHTPKKSPTAWMRAGTHADSFWGSTIRQRIASQVPQIRHWKLMEGSVIDEPAPVDKATWFVDPPYQKRAFITDALPHRSISKS